MSAEYFKQIILVCCCGAKLEICDNRGGDSFLTNEASKFTANHKDCSRLKFPPVTQPAKEAP